MVASPGSGIDGTTLMEVVSVGVCVQDAGMRFTYANPAAMRLLGLSRAELPGRAGLAPAGDCVDVEGKPLPIACQPPQVALRTGRPVNDVVMGLGGVRPGRRVWLQVSSTPRLDRAGRVRDVVTTLCDITAAHDVLRATDKVHRSVIRAMSEGVVVHRADGAIHMANPSAERILGVTVEQMAGRSPLEPSWRLVRADGQPIVPEEIPSEITQRTGQPCENIIMGAHQPQGDLVWLSVNTDPIFDEERGTPLGVVATFTDITRERHATLELERSRSRLSQVIDALPGVVYQYRLRRGGRDSFDFVSRQVERVLGVTAEHMMSDSNTAFALVHPDDLAALRAAISASARQLSIWEHTFRFRRPDGGLIWLRGRAIPVRAGEDTIWTGVIFDVTEAHHMAEGLERAQRREAMAALAAGVAHNFNNMLGAILPNLELALASCPDALKPLLIDARDATSSAAELVRRLLLLGRPDVGDGAAAACDLVQVVRGALDICRRTFDRAISIEAALAVDAAPVPGHRSELEQVVLNLCLNARDALENRPDPRLSVGIARDGRHFVLRVEDNGAGMSPETLERVGEPFFTTKEPGRGTGLGLAMIMRTLSDLGGQLSCDSTLGEGTRFALRFPSRWDGAVGRAAREVAARAMPKGTILVVDDEELVRQTLCRVLERAGLSTIAVARGDEALARLSALSPAAFEELRAVILDLSLPGLAGADVLSMIRERWPRLPVLVLSGHVPDPDLLVKATAVLEKPLGASALLEALHGAMAD